MVIYWTSLSNLQACKVLGMMEYLTSTYRNGYLDWVIFQGRINKEIFLTFVHEKVLPYCNPWPGPCSIIVLDNASIHKDQELQDMCNAAGVKLHFLLPYSPDFNPIELTFKDLKAWIKWYWRLMGDFQALRHFYILPYSRIKVSMLMLTMKHVAIV